MISLARITAALALAGAIISSPAYAATLGEARSVVVRTADLNLTSMEGRATLTRRITYATAIVCGRADARDLIASRLTATCRSEALQNALPQIQLALAGHARGIRLAANTRSVTAKAF